MEGDVYLQQHHQMSLFELHCSYTIYRQMVEEGAIELANTFLDEEFEQYY